MEKDRQEKMKERIALHAIESEQAPSTVNDADILRARARVLCKSPTAVGFAGMAGPRNPFCKE